MTGSIVRADNSGLGNVAREFWDNGIIKKVVIFPNNVFTSFPERFPGAPVVQEIDDEVTEYLLDGVDKLLFFETPFDWSILGKAKKRGIKTIIMPNHECLPDPPPANPDLWLCPSLSEMELKIHPRKYLPTPVNTKRVKWRLRKRARVFVHNSGHGGLNARNGTFELIEAMKYVKSPIKLIIRSQSHELVSKDPRIDIRFTNVKDYWDLWNEGDVFIFPEKFNGQSLPINEAFAAGMLVMSTNRRPFNTWLPNEPLIKPSGFHKTHISRTVEAAKIDPYEIARTIDKWYNQDIESFSLDGRDWAEKNSWASLRASYLSL